MHPLFSLMEHSAQSLQKNFQFPTVEVHRKLKTVPESFYILRGGLILAVCCNTIFVAMGMLAFPFFFMTYQAAMTLIVLVLGAYGFTYFGDPATSGRRKWEGFRQSFVFKDIIRWFQGDVIKTCDIPEGQYIFAYGPHGVMPFCPLWMQFHENWKRYFPKLQPIPLTSSVIHRLPLVRELAQWSGTREITKRSFENLLTKGKSVIMVPGGVKELQLSRSGSLQIEFNGSHKGFVKLALRHGVSIIPTLGVGETEVFDAIEVPFFSQLCRRLGMPFPYFTGLGGIWQIPRRPKVTVIVGSPIPVPKVESPDQELIDKIHKEFYLQTIELFEKYKNQLGYSQHSISVKYL